MRATGETTPPIELKLRRLDGSIVPVYSIATPLSTNPLVFLAVHSDLTEREQAAQLIRSVMQSVTDAILTIDETGTLQTVNPATTRIFGYRDDELLGRNVNCLIPEPHRRLHDTYISNYLRTGLARIIGRTVEMEGVRSDGSKFPVEVSVSEFALNGQRRFTGVVRDISARRQLEGQILQAQKMQAIGRLAGGIAHDFNNMLMVINGHCELLFATLDADSPYRPSIEAMYEAGTRAARLTGQLLAYSRKALIEPRPVHLNEAIMETAQLLRPFLGSTIHLETELAATMPLVHMDHGQLEQVLMNLVLNARDAMPAGGRIRLSTRVCELSAAEVCTLTPLKPGSYAELSISDTGIGMSEQIQAHIFEPFFTTKDVGQGTGLGLAVVEGIMAQAGGTIRVRSAVGVGTTFTLWFPVANPAVPLDPADNWVV
jgi:PAS domain S-box-containing protein